MHNCRTKCRSDDSRNEFARFGGSKRDHQVLQLLALFIRGPLIEAYTADSANFTCKGYMPKIFYNAKNSGRSHQPAVT